MTIPHTHSGVGLTSMAAMTPMPADMTGSLPHQRFTAEMEVQYQQWMKASSDVPAMYAAGTPAINPNPMPNHTNVTASSQAMMYGMMGHNTGGHMYMQQQPMQHLMSSPMLEGLTPGLDMAFVDNDFGDGQGADDFLTADPTVLGLLAGDP